MLMAKDPYKLLNVPNNAKDAEIQKAYRLLAKKYHPDVNKDKPLMAEKFKEISDDIININSNYIDQEFKQNFFRKYLFYDKMLLRPKIEILLKNIEVKK